MNASEIFDSVLALGFFMLAIIILGALYNAVDNLLDPPSCNCAQLRKQTRETEGVTR